MRSLESVSIRTGIFGKGEALSGCFNACYAHTGIMQGETGRRGEPCYLSGGDHRIRRRGEASVQITSDQKWSITSIDQLWVDASIPEGVPGVTVTVKFTFEHNPTSSVRTANVTVVSGSTRGSITITQQAGFDPSSIDVSKIYIPWR